MRNTPEHTVLAANKQFQLSIFRGSKIVLRTHNAELEIDGAYLDMLDRWLTVKAEMEEIAELDSAEY